MVLVALGQFGGQGVETNHIAQHEQEAGLEHIAALCKDGVEVGPVPLQCAVAIFVGHLHRKRHVRFDSRHFQLFEQSNQAWVGAFVVDQEACVDAMRLRASWRG